MVVTIPDGYAQVDLKWIGPFDRGEGHTIFGVLMSGGNTPTSTAGIIADAAETAFPSFLNNYYFLSSVTVRTATAIAVAPGFGVGLRGGDAEPPQVCMLTRFNTGLRGRAHQGRNYWPGFLNDGDVNNGGYISSTVTDAMQTAFEVFGGEYTAADVFNYILHSDPGVTPTEVTGITVESKVATQRRRLR